jgi:hypothetical protein
MTVCRITEMWCDDCMARESHETLADAKAHGWERRRIADGSVVDLCPPCVEGDE